MNGNKEVNNGTSKKIKIQEQTETSPQEEKGHPSPSQLS
jgi:hypothetical protein